MIIRFPTWRLSYTPETGLSLKSVNHTCYINISQKISRHRGNAVSAIDGFDLVVAVETGATIKRSHAICLINQEFSDSTRIFAKRSVLLSIHFNIGKYSDNCSGDHAHAAAFGVHLANNLLVQHDSVARYNAPSIINAGVDNSMHNYLFSYVDNVPLVQTKHAKCKIPKGAFIRLC